MIVSWRLIVVAPVTEVDADADEDDVDDCDGKSSRVLAVTGTIAGDLSFRIGRELTVVVL